MLLYHESDQGEGLSLAHQQRECIAKCILTLSIVAYFPAFVLYHMVSLENYVKNVAPSFDFRRTWEFTATIGTITLLSRDKLGK